MEYALISVDERIEEEPWYGTRENLERVKCRVLAAYQALEKKGGLPGGPLSQRCLRIVPARRAKKILARYAAIGLARYLAAQIPGEEQYRILLRQVIEMQRRESASVSV